MLYCIIEGWESAHALPGGIDSTESLEKKFVWKEEKICA